MQLKWNKSYRLLLASFLMVLSYVSMGAVPHSESPDTVAPLLRNELMSKHPGARIELTGQIQWTRGGSLSQVSSVSILNETPRGEFQFAVRGEQAGEYAEGWCTFAAWIPARIALRRLLPGEKLSSEAFSNQEINVASGQAYEFRGVVLPRDADVSHLQARQTILEGQFLVSNAVERVPDVRRGDIVRVEVQSGSLRLMTQGTAEEPGYLSGQVRVMAGKAKRELVGLLREGGVVEVKL